MTKRNDGAPLRERLAKVAEVPEDVEEFFEWARSRPDVIKALMLKWPPAAIVRARPGKKLVCPAPGGEAAIASYFEDGNVSVVGRDLLGLEVNAVCDPEWLELVRFDVVTREDMEVILEHT